MFVQRAKLDSYNKPIPPHDTYILSNEWIKKLYHTICPRKICRHGWSPKNRCDMLYHLDTIDSITKQMKEVLQNCKKHGQVIKKWRRHNRDKVQKKPIFTSPIGQWLMTVLPKPCMVYCKCSDQYLKGWEKRAQHGLNGRNPSPSHMLLGGPCGTQVNFQICPTSVLRLQYPSIGCQ